MGILTDKGALPAPASDDFLHIVDVDDPASNPAGTSKKIEAGNLVTQQLAYTGTPKIDVSNADGPLEISNTGKTTPTIKIGGSAGFPTTSLSLGCLHPDSDGTLYSYDPTRSNWLSVEGHRYDFTDNGNNDGQYLRIGNIVSTTVGYVMPFDGSITAIKASTGGGLATKSLVVQKNTASLLPFSLTSGSFTDLTVNVDFSAGDIIQVFVSASGGSINDPLVSIYTKWRK